MERKPELEPGLYDQVISEAVAEALSNLDVDRVVRRPIQVAEAGSRIGWHVARELEQLLNRIPDARRLEVATEVVRALAESLLSVVEDAETTELVVAPSAEVLRSVGFTQPDGSIGFHAEPLISLLDTTLLTNAPGEPRLGHQLGKEINSADRIDVLMAFIRVSGIAPFRDELRRHVDRGRPLRFLTTTYTGSTQVEALDDLADLGAEIRVSYSTDTTRLHAKAWLFNRRTGFTTAYIGSSNLTHSAMVPGLEWNVRISGARNHDVVEKFEATFESYWNSDEFVPYRHDEFVERTTQSNGSRSRFALSSISVSPRPFQERLLELLAVARQQGHHQNLLVAATGTGKTVMAALDYQSLRRSLPQSRLLFVAHRQEILEQAHATFCQVLGDGNFGEQWVGGARPATYDHVFASVQSLSHVDLDDLDPKHFDVVIIDEFHHSAAATYRRLLEHLQPVELVGLTATPERADGQSVLEWFGHRITAELRLWDAIDQQLLCPFLYYGIHDGLDLQAVPWRRGRGYDVSELENVYTANDVWVRRVITQVQRHVGNPLRMKALGFCVSVAHAEFMARSFNEAGIPATTVSASTSSTDRSAALSNLRSGVVNVVFSVDLFNEGVDIPSVDTLLFLRPTESATVFLQQLGRGLRLEYGKAACTVLDFVGLHRSEFRFDRVLRGLLGGSRRDLERAVAEGFPYLPAGCEMKLDRKSTEIILDSIRSAVPSTWAARVSELKAHLAAGHERELGSFLLESGIELDELYSSNRGWSDLCEAAGAPLSDSGPAEKELRRAVGRLLHVDDRERLLAYQSFARTEQEEVATRVDAMTPLERRQLRMFLSQLIDQVPRQLLPADADLAVALEFVVQHSGVCVEIAQLVDVLLERIDHLYFPLQLPAGTPLNIHARYSRLEVLAAIGHRDPDMARVSTWQTGVMWLPDQQTDMFAFTLDKTDGNFSPTTRYRDYAISPELIHWESQGVTRANSDTGLRYQQHAELGSTVLLFARLRSNDRAFWLLGPATYVSHVGERPMAITWKLEHRLPGDLFQQFAAAVA